MAGNNYKIKVTLSDGSIKELPFTAPEGPRGPKGDCRGVSVHKVLNAGELQSLVSSMADTQSVSSIFAVYGSHRQQLVVLGLTATQFTYGFVVTDSPDSETPESIQTISYPLDEAATRFSVSNGTGGTASADYLEVYIYDSETPSGSDIPYTKEETDALLAKKVSYLRREGDGILPQAKVPAYSSVGGIPTDMDAFKSAFSTGSYEFTNGLSLDCFAFIGGTLHSVQVSADSESTIYVEGQTALEDGAVVCMYSQYVEGYVNYQVIESSSTGAKAIYDVLYPQNCKFHLEVAGQATIVYFSGLSDVSVRFNVQAISSNAAQGAVFVNSCYNSDYYVDCSGLGVSSDGGTTLLVYLDDKNAAIPTGSQYLGESDFSSEHPGVQEYRICNGSWGQDERCVQTKPFADKPTVLKGTATRFYQNFVVRDSSWVFSDGTKLRRDVRISLVGYAPMVTRPVVYEGAQ